MVLLIKVALQTNLYCHKTRTRKNNYASSTTSGQQMFHIYSVIKGNQGCHGSSILGSNHTSILIHLNDGNKFGNSYCEKSHTLIKDLFFYQEKHINHWNSVLYNEYRLQAITLFSMFNLAVVLTGPIMYRTKLICVKSYCFFYISIIFIIYLVQAPIEITPVVTLSQF